MKQRLIGLSLILIVSIAALVVVVVVLNQFVFHPPDKPKAQEVQVDIGKYGKYVVETGDITTDLKDHRYVLLNFTIMTDSKKAQETLTDGLFLVKREVIGVLSEMTSEQLMTESGVVEMEKAIQSRLQTYLPEGKVIMVATTKKVIQ
ncbi:MAG: flagellar basal body-associated FliL family protein [Candidatus Carbobacillus altaicus]|nr:flagellar basal body-associated FliL family protein [Candidatus Carbobacillus altaicus]